MERNVFVQFCVLTSMGVDTRVDWYLVPWGHEITSSDFVQRVLQADGDCTAGRSSDDMFVLDALQGFRNGVAVDTSGAHTPSEVPNGIIIAKQHWYTRMV
jgi:hypothetical protein